MVIPCYNSAAYVAVAVTSALAQTVAAREVIVVDDGSIDDPTAALSAIDDARLRMVYAPNRGVSHARNLGVELATGELVAFLDADDYWYPSKLERQLALFEVDPPPVAVGAQMHHVDSRGTLLGVTGVTELDDKRQELVRAGALMPFVTSSSVISRKALQDVGGFDETFRVAQDLDLMARLAARGPVATVSEPLGAYRVHPASASAREYRSQQQRSRFIRARISARDAGGELTWQEYLADRESETKREWWDDTARSLYRAAGVLAAEQRYIGASWRLGLSVAMKPAHAIPRMRSQRVIANLRERDRKRTG